MTPTSPVPADVRSRLFERACVVVIDDEPANVMLLERLLRAEGCTDVHGVTDPRQAVACCLDLEADLVLLDLNMPHIDGFGVMADLEGALPDDSFIPVLVLTADAATDQRDRALRAGAKDFLTKPFDHTEVILRAGNLLQTRTLYTSLEAHNVKLRTELEGRKEQERRAAEDYRLRRERIEEVLTGNTLSMAFQPIADLRTGQFVGAEALARFTGEPARPPNEWFDEAASVGLGAELELAAARAAASRFNDLSPGMFLSINVSPQTVDRPEIACLLDAVPADRLVLELTEHAQVEDYQPLLAKLSGLREQGAKLAVDDAGAGYASLRHILTLRPDILKLDLALTRGIDSDPARRALAIAMVAFASELDATVIAEGIETQRELETLQALNIPNGQGFHLARPGQLPLPDTRLAWLTASAHVAPPEPAGLHAQDDDDRLT